MKHFTFLLFLLLACAAMGQTVADSRAAAERGDNEAQYQLGLRYLKGSGVPQDTKLALSWLLKSAEAGNVKARLAVGNFYNDSKEYDKAFPWYKKAAVDGDSEAQQKLGCLYFLGWGTDKDEAEAISWFRESAESGNVAGQTQMGAFLYDSKKYEQAMYFFRKSAEKGSTLSFYYIGEMYRLGLGVPCDLPYAIKCYREAANHGVMEAEFWMGWGYYDANSFGLETDLNAALYWFRKSLSHPGETLPEALRKQVESKVRELEQKGYKGLFSNDMPDTPALPVKPTPVPVPKTVSTRDLGNGVYTGELVDDLRHGWGTYKWKNGDTFVGNWVKNHRDHGTLTLANSVYVGSFIHDRVEGYGYRDYGSCVYYGSFNDNSRHGPGVIVSKRDWSLSNCPGSLYYAGSFEGGKKVGVGSCYDKNGKRLYHGPFKDDRPVDTYPMKGVDPRFSFGKLEVGHKGDYYEGELYEGKIHGTGVYHFANGKLWIGKWKVGKSDERGVYVEPDGKTTVGPWISDKPVR